MTVDRGGILSLRSGFLLICRRRCGCCRPSPGGCPSRPAGAARPGTQPGPVRCGRWPRSAWGWASRWRSSSSPAPWSTRKTAPTARATSPTTSCCCTSATRLTLVPRAHERGARPDGSRSRTTGRDLGRRHGGAARRCRRPEHHRGPPGLRQHGRLSVRPARQAARRRCLREPHGARRHPRGARVGGHRPRVAGPGGRREHAADRRPDLAPWPQRSRRGQVRGPSRTPRDAGGPAHRRARVRLAADVVRHPRIPGTAGVHEGPVRLAGRGRRPAHRRRAGARPGRRRPGPGCSSSPPGHPSRPPCGGRSPPRSAC